ncbi:hypothetical protein E6O75_ATG04438 [Venturia nashicola]|uniref:Uncharacterized protein n=1 Tax=Venturia nashicola TaxID=86259 RepID=A0A4Z1P7X1_9PEZI|nr:hypothetical protein E6O75_ATG04438 [Venturia nashicola]
MQGKCRNQIGDNQNSQAKNPQPRSNPPISQANLSKEAPSSFSTRVPSGKYPCLICTHRGNFPNSSKPPKIGRVNVTYAQVIQATYEYDLANIHCPICSTDFSTIIGHLSTEEQVYGRWRWAIETFGNCQYILEYAHLKAGWRGTAGRWRYALFADYMHHLGDESDTDEWPGYPDVIESWEADDDQEGAVFVVGDNSAEEPLEIRDPIRAAHLASLARGILEADAEEKKLLEAEERAKERKVKPPEPTWKQRKRERRLEREQERRNDEEVRLREKKYEALQRRGGLTHEEILITIAGDDVKRREKEQTAAKNRNKSSADIQAERIAVAEREIAWIDGQDTGELDDDGNEVPQEPKEPEQPKEPKYKMRKKGETDAMYEKRVSKADKTAATKAANKIQRELEQQQSARQVVVQSGSDSLREAQQSPEGTAEQPVPPHPPAMKTSAQHPPGWKKSDARKEGESDKQYASRMIKAAAQARMKEAKSRAQQSAADLVPAPNEPEPSQTMSDDLPEVQAKADQKGKNAQPKISLVKRKRTNSSEDSITTEHGNPPKKRKKKGSLEEGGEDPEDATAVEQGGLKTKRKSGPRKPKRQPGDPVTFLGF